MNNLNIADEEWFYLQRKIYDQLKFTVNYHIPVNIYFNSVKYVLDYVVLDGDRSSIIIFAIHTKNKMRYRFSQTGMNNKWLKYNTKTKRTGDIEQETIKIEMNI